MRAPADGCSPAPGIGYTPGGNNNTALQDHVAFFDPDGDGVIWPTDTIDRFHGVRALDFNLFWAIVSVLVIHGGFSYLTWGTWIPDVFFRLKVRHMHRAKHGSDTEAYTSTGEFDEKRFNYIFDMYSQPPHNALSFWEGVRMIHGNMNGFDPFGWSAAVFEWWASYYMIWPEDKHLSKEDVRAIYDGSIFYKIARRKSPKSQN